MKVRKVGNVANDFSADVMPYLRKRASSPIPRRSNSSLKNALTYDDSEISNSRNEFP